MRARDVMVQAVATTTPETTVEKVARLMINLRISGVPVLDRNGQLAGIVTEGDLLRRAETGTERQRSRWSRWFSANSRLAAEYIKSHARRVEDIMTREVVSVGELASLDEIAQLMETKRITRVPVVHHASSSASSAGRICSRSWPAVERRPATKREIARSATDCSPSCASKNGRGPPSPFASVGTGD